MRIQPAHAVNPVRVMIVLGTPAEMNGLLVLGARHLVAVIDLLMEHAEFVAQAVTDHRQIERRTAVHEAGGQPPEAAVAETGVGLFVDHVFEFDRKIHQRIGRFLFDVQVEQVIAERAADQEFQRQVVGLAGIRLALPFPCLVPSRHDPVAYRQREGLIKIERDEAHEMAEVVAKIAMETLRQRLTVGRQRCHFLESNVFYPVFVIHAVLATAWYNVWYALALASQPRSCCIAVMQT